LARNLDWLAVFITAFMAIGNLLPMDPDALRAFTTGLTGLGLGDMVVLGLLLVPLVLASYPALGWLCLRLVSVGQYRVIKAGCLLLCGLGAFVLAQTGVPFLGVFDAVVLLLFLTTYGL
jgi:hypothetical protein